MATVHFGWALQTSHSGSREAEGETFAVNVIMPGAAASPEWWRPGTDLPMSVQEAQANFGGLLCPWKWNDLAENQARDNWQGFKWNGAAWERLAATYLQTTASPSNVSELRRDALAWVGKQGAKCGKAFSLDPEYTAHEKRSLPHALAPMTHLAAPLSGPAMGMSMHFVLSAGAGEQIVVVPRELVADVDKSRKWTLVGEPQGAPGQAPVVAVYEEKLAAAERLKIGADAVEIHFATQPATVAAAAVRKPVTTTVTTLALSAVQLRYLLARHLHPAALFAAALEEGGADAAQILAADFTELFAWSLGAGDIGVPMASGSPRRQVFPQMLLEPRLVRGTWNDNDIDLANVRAAGKPLCEAMILASKSLPATISAFVAKPSDAGFVAAAQALAEESESRTSATWTAWFVALTRQFLGGSALKPALDQRLATKINKPDGFGRGAWLHRLSVMDGGKFWESRGAQDPAALLLSARNKVVDEIAQTLGLKISGDAALRRAKDELANRLGTQNAPDVLNDAGLRVEFEDAAASDQEIRGYALALQAAIGADAAAAAKAAKDADAAWITATSLVANDGKGNLEWVMQGGKRMILHETVGSTFEGGMRVGAVEYRGRSLVSAPAASDGRLLDRSSMDVPEKREFFVDNRSVPDELSGPLLAYGAWYRAAAAVLDNAGGELGVAQAGNADLGAASAQFGKVPAAEWERYLSRVKPGAPTISGMAAWRTELSNETRLHAFWKESKKPGEPPPVSCLAPAGNSYRKLYTDPLQLTIGPPVTDAGFIERWFNRAIIEAVGDDKSKAKVERDRLIALDPSRRFHPAVRTVRIELLDRDGNDLKPAVRLQLGDPQKAIPQPFEVSVGNHALTTSGAAIPKGTCAQLRFTSLVEEKLVTPGSDQRFAADLAQPKGGWWILGSTELWVEALEEPKAIDPKDEWIGLAPAGNGLSLTLKAPCDASFVRRFNLERHEWHWTGYDVRFPSKKDPTLADVAHTLVNVGSYRESIESRALDTDADLKAPAQPLHNMALPSVRGARFVAFTARPVMRFRKWLEETIIERAEADVIAAGTIVKGAAGALASRRVTAPAWSDAMPLCQTYEKLPKQNGPVAGDYARVANGCLLVFDEPIRRTDELASLGGIGETIEVDVVETRIKDVFEHGVNPIFHPPVAADDLKFAISQPFGLTYDIGQNPKVAQTAVVMTPQSATHGRWVMCKARARRIYLPELMEDSVVPREKVEADEGYWMPTREDRDCAVPPDFCVDFDGVPEKLQLEMLVPQRLPLKLPELSQLPAGVGGHRLLVTWHKLRWGGTSEPSWRAQVFLQSADTGRMAWRTHARMSAYQQQDAKLALDVDLTAWRIDAEKKGKPVECIVRRVLASDYSEPQWISFIGSFGQMLKAPHEYRLQWEGESLRLDEMRYGAWTPAGWPNAPGKDDTVFQLLLLYATAEDAMRGLVDETAGDVRGWFAPAAQGRFAAFGKIRQGAKFAYLLSFQRRNSGVMPQFKSWEEVQAGLFPAEDKECSVRLLPEYLGPIHIEPRVDK